MHFTGIGGIGMCGLAEYFLKNGYSVSGSDLFESHITDRLKSLGAVIYKGHSAGNITNEIETVVYTSAAKDDNPELVKANELGLTLLKRAEMLGRIVNDKFLIAIAGTHGKTTTTAMIGKLLTDAGLDPLVFVGGNVNMFEGAAARLGSGNYAVVEADEYDRSFLTLRPDIAVVTSIDEDHLDIYKDLEDIKETFFKFLGLSKKGGKIIYCGDDENIKEFIGKLQNDKISYGYDEKNYLRISGMEVLGNSMNFSIMNSKSLYDNINVSLIGKHNVLNSAACFAVSKSMHIGFDVYKRSISGFKTVDRRLQLVYDADGIKVYDDYAHHPKEISSSLSGLREVYASSRLVAVFQPHLYSRTRDFYRDFAVELSFADEILLLDIYPAREEPVEGVTSRLILDEMKKISSNVKYFPGKDDLIKYLGETVKSGDVIVFQGAGTITDFCSDYLKVLDVLNN